MYAGSLPSLPGSFFPKFLLQNCDNVVNASVVVSFVIDLMGGCFLEGIVGLFARCVTRGKNALHFMLFSEVGTFFTLSVCHIFSEFAVCFQQWLKAGTVSF